jgi:pimeloyl-ACP methyl ester carboxylesterase
LKHHATRLAGLISISGTACYTKKDDFPHGLPAPILRTMRKAFASNPQKVLSDFYQACYLPEEHTPTHTGNHDILVKGLQYLEEWDMRHTLTSLNIPIHALHGRNDAITHLAAAIASFGEQNVTILETASHALPLTHTAECVTFLHQCLKQQT